MANELKNAINFTQHETSNNQAKGDISIELPISLVEIGQTVEYSDNGKLLPSFEGKISFEVTLEDGTVTNISGRLALWYDKKHVKSAKDAAKEAVLKAEKEAKDAEIRKQKESLLQNFTPEQIQSLINLGMLEKEGK